MAKKSDSGESKGKMSFRRLQNFLNKKADTEVAFSLSDSPTDVREWIPTGSTWLDKIICKGKTAGIPVGRITELSGLSASGKSFMALQIASNAIKLGKMVIYFEHLQIK